MSAVSSSLVLIFVGFSWLGSVLATSGAANKCAPVNERARNYTLMLASLLLAALLLLMVWPAAIEWTTYERYHPWMWRLLALLLLLGVSSYFDLKRRGAKPCRVTFLFGILVLAGGTFLLSISGCKENINLVILRYLHLTSAVSPLPSCLFFLAAGLWWTWYSLDGAVLIDQRRPRLPSAEVMGIRYRYLTEEGNADLLAVLRPFTPDLRAYMLACAVLFFTLVTIDTSHPVQTLEGQTLDWLFTVALLGVVLTLLTTLSQLLIGWMECRQLLLALDRIPLRRGFKRLSGFSWKPIWSVGGNSLQDSYRVISREMEAFGHVSRDNPKLIDDTVFAQLRSQILISLDDIYDKTKPWKYRQCKMRCASFNDDLISGVEKFQQALATGCGAVFKSLEATWAAEQGVALFESQDPERTTNPPKSKIPPETQVREHFVCLVYLNFLLVTLSRMRTLILTTAGMYVFLLLATTVYPLEPKLTLRPLLILLLLFVVAVVGSVYAQMHRDPTLSRLTDTKPGELGGDFWVRILSFSAVPLLSLILAQFPDVTNFVFSWLQPAMQALSH
jgi:hypothetical protein